MSKKEKCPVCDKNLVISKDTAHNRRFLVCPKMDKESFSEEEVKHYRASLKRIFVEAFV